MAVKPNREKAAAFVAGLFLVLAVWEAFRSPAGPSSTAPQDFAVPTSSRELIPRRHRVFKESADPGRNPFTFSEGWQSLETSPMAPPPLPPAARPIPSLGSGAGFEDVGFLFESAIKAPPAAKEVTR